MMTTRFSCEKLNIGHYFIVSLLYEYELNMDFVKKRVSFDDCITIRHYDFERDVDMVEKSGENWLETRDLVCREFFMPVELGGCGCKWHILEHKLNALKEPCWRMIGMLWNRLYPFSKFRIEETTDVSNSTLSSLPITPTEPTADNVTEM